MALGSPIVPEGFSSSDWLRLTVENGKALAGPSGRRDLEVTLSDLKRHNKRKNAWTAINGNAISEVGWLYSE